MSFSAFRTAELHGAEWRDWIIQNITRSCDLGEMLNSMVSSQVWTEADARQALREATQLLLASGAPRKLPFITESRSAKIDNQFIEISARSASPYLAVLENLLTESECRQLIGIAVEKGFDNSGVVDDQSGQSVSHIGRTSRGVFFRHDEHYLVDEIVNRISKLTDWPSRRSEGLQLLRYEIGEKYEPHYDWFDITIPGAKNHLARGGQRVATTVIYLATPDAGGGTNFPRLGAEFTPRSGSAVFFRNLTEASVPDERSLHGGSPVVRGHKIVATFWQRESDFY